MIRDDIKEILKVRGRNADYYAIGFISRFKKLESAFQYWHCVDDEMQKYFPIGLIACLEGFYRGVFKLLLETGSPFLDNAKRFKNIDFNFDLLTALHYKKITIGEYISYLLPLSSLIHINNHMSVLLGLDFLAEVQTVHDRWRVEIKGESPIPIISDPAKTFSDLQWLFEMRHIYAHEFATSDSVKPDKQRIESCFHSVELVAKATDQLLGNKLNPDEPLTQGGMAQQARDFYAEERRKMKEAYQELHSILKKTYEDREDTIQDPEFTIKLKASQDAWEAYLEAEVEFQADLCGKGGSIWSTIWAGTAEKLTKVRLQDLTESLKVLQSS